MPLPGLNAAFSLATNLLGVRADPYQVFNFFVEIEGILAGGFSECSGLQVETEVKDYEEGGLNDYTHRFRGRTKYPPIVLKHGMTIISGLWDWHQEVVRGNVERKNGTIYLLDAMRIPTAWWNFKGAFPTKWTGPELRAASGDVAFETVELVHQGLSHPSLGDLLGGFSLEISGSLDISGGFF
ncbi:MAG TPA: phage tail protein [Blastocatellia bacterium]|nr:phage tail protein [Blastocatellia bacterium]